MVSDFPETIDVSAEREYARHLARRLLNEASLAPMEGRAGSVCIPRMDPVFGRSVRPEPATARRPDRHHQSHRTFTA